MADIDEEIAELRQRLVQLEARRLDDAPSHSGTTQLARSGRVEFVLSGDDFSALGQAYSLGENPIYLIRTLPQKLQPASGAPAFDTWSGGELGVLGKQLEDSNTFAQAWIEDAPPNP